MLLVAVALD